MKYRLRTLLIVLAIGPPVLAGGWPVVERFWNSRRVETWEDVAGPGMIFSYDGPMCNLKIDDPEASADEMDD